MPNDMDYTTKLVEEVRKDVRDIHRVLFRGNGKPGVVSRLDRLEEWRRSAAAMSNTWRTRAWDAGKGIIIALVTAVVTLLGYGNLM